MEIRDIAIFSSYIAQIMDAHLHFLLGANDPFETISSRF